MESQEKSQTTLPDPTHLSLSMSPSNAQDVRMVEDQTILPEVDQNFDSPSVHLEGSTL